MPKIDIDAVEWKGGTGYPPPFDALVAGRERKRLGDAVGLTQFGVNLARIAPGSASAQRHWHQHEDEFVYILDGEAHLVEDGGETVLRPGDAAAFRAGVANGHHLVNRSDRDLVYLEIGTRCDIERVDYPDIDLRAETDETGNRYLHKDGSPYE